MMPRQFFRPAAAGVFAMLLLISGCASTARQQRVSVEDVEMKKRALDLFVEGKNAEAKGNHDAAIPLYFEALQYNPQSPDILLALSKTFIASGKALSAIHFANRAVSVDPANVESWRILQYLYQQTGDIARAAECLETVLKLKPDSDIGVVFRLAQYYGTMGKDDRARKVLLDRARNPDLPKDEMSAIAEYLSQSGFIDDAISVYTRLTEKDPADVDSWVALGSLYDQTGNEAKAEEIYRNALELNPGNVFLYISIGNNCMNQNKWDCAINYFERARASGIENPKLMSTLTSLYYYADRLQEAEALRDSVISMGADDAQFYFFLGKALGFRDRHEESAEYFRQGFSKPLDELSDEQKLNAYAGYANALIRTKRPDEALRVIREDAVKNIKEIQYVKDIEGSIYQEMKRYDDAIAIYLWLMDADPENPRYLVALTQAYNGAGKYSDAEALLLDALKEDPDNTRYLMQLGIVYDYTKELEKAEEVLLKVIRKEPGNTLALNNLAYMYIENNRNISKAIQMVKRALKTDPDNGAYLDTLAWGYYRKGNIKEARQHVEQAIANANRLDKGVIYDHYGDILLQLGLKDQARDAYRKAIEFGESAEKIQPKIDALDR